MTDEPYVNSKSDTIRSKAKWVDEGEKNTSTLNKNQANNSINRLRTGNKWRSIKNERNSGLFKVNSDCQCFYTLYIYFML